MSRNRSSNTRANQYPSKREKKKEQLILEQRSSNHIRREPDVKKKFTKHDMYQITPMTDNQMHCFREWAQEQHLVMEGVPGTGKTFIAMCLALQTVLDPNTPQNKIVIVRSAVGSRNVGFLPGTEDEKIGVYETPYRQICDKLFSWKNTYDNLKEIGVIEFESTSFLRGVTFDDAVVIFDEFQNTNEVECETVLTRVGDNTRVIVCGDAIHQNDLGKISAGISTLAVMKKMPTVTTVTFGVDDIVRSGFVKEFILARYHYV